MHELTARQPKHILVLEDDADTAAVTKLMLESPLPGAPDFGTRAGDAQPGSHESKCIYGQWIVTVAGTLATATDLLHHNSFDVALIDLILPDGQRDDVIHIIHEAAPDLPLVVQSGLSDTGMVRRLLWEGSVADYIVKGDVKNPIALKQRLCHAIDRFHVLREADAVSHSIATNSPLPQTGLHHCCK